MRKFTDNDGRAWVLRLTLGHTEQAMAEMGLDLLNPVDRAEGKSSALARLNADPRAFVGLAWIMIEAQAEKAGVTPETFGGNLDGPKLAELQEIVLGEVSDFFRCLGRDDLLAACDVQRVMRDRFLRSLGAEYRTAGERGPTDGEGSGGSPGSQGSTPEA